MPVDSDPVVAPESPRNRRILFVCTGNTCRSPLAEVLCKKLLADTLGCSPNDLPAHGIEVMSAGVAALPGDAPSEIACAIAEEYGVDLASHRSRTVNPELLASATDVVTMTRTHAMVLAYRFPGIGPPPLPLCGDEGDLPDPIGGDHAVYRTCAETIQHYLREHLTRWIGR